MMLRNELHAQRDGRSNFGQATKADLHSTGQRNSGASALAGCPLSAVLSTQPEPWFQQGVDRVDQWARGDGEVAAAAAQQWERM